MRAELASHTRARIIDTAHELLLAHGYFAMTVPLLAKRAGVSPQTVYNSVGGKSDVVKAVYDILLAGDDEPVPMSERPEFRSVIDAPDTPGYTRAYAAWSRGIWERVGPLLGVILAHGPGGDEGLERFLSTIDHERLLGNRHSLQGLSDRGMLPVERTIDELVVAVWTLTAPEVYDRLVRRSGWSPSRYETWLAAQLKAALHD